MQLPSILVIGLLVLMAVEFVSFLEQMQAFLFHLSLGTPAIQMKNQYYVNQSWELWSTDSTLFMKEKHNMCKA